MILLTSIYVTHSFKRSTSPALLYSMTGKSLKSSSPSWKLKLFHGKIKLLRIDGRIFFFTLALQGIPAEGGVLLFEGNVRPSVLARRKRSALSLVPLWAELSGSVPEKRSLPSLAGFPNLFCKNFSFPQSLKIFHWKIKLLRIDGRISFFTLALLGIPA